MGKVVEGEALTKSLKMTGGNTGWRDGSSLGEYVGIYIVGDDEVGNDVGKGIGAMLGLPVGAHVGMMDGRQVGVWVGEADG